jgi:N-methylhydantoinase B
VLGGFVSAEKALDEYGVVLVGPTSEIDEAATAALRRDRPAAELFHRFQYSAGFA